MNQEHQTLTERRLSLLESISLAADEIAVIDREIEELLQGRKPGAGAA